MTTNGTPKTLEEALSNALHESQYPEMMAVHIRDFIAQKLTVLSMTVAEDDFKTQVAIEKFANAIGVPFKRPLGEGKTYD